MEINHNLFLLSIILVIGSGVLNAVCGLFTKKSKNKGVFLGSMMLVPSIVLSPHLIIELIHADLPIKAYVLIVCSMSLQAINGILLIRTYTFGDLSQVYPIMRGTGVMLIPIIGVLFLDESLTWWGWLGVIGIVIGIFLLSGWNPLSTQDHLSLHPIYLAVLVGLCITSYTVVDKMTLQYLSPLSLLQVGNLGFLLAFIPHLIKQKQLQVEWKLNWKFILLGSLFSPGSYLLFLMAITMAPVSHLAPIREIGTVFAALLGIILLKEKQGWKRIVTSFLIVLGIVTIGIAG
jgi:drug/metabolite transporter (DMT)-like permease